VFVHVFFRLLGFLQRMLLQARNKGRFSEWSRQAAWPVRFLPGTANAAIVARRRPPGVLEARMAAGR
ncbi:MAG: hypothetical protein J5960_00260, partial [Desulfovibrio sp.]|nr:hypothetical protein [Desulfovibrio sp.]